MRIAGVQAASAYLDRAATIKKVLAAMEEASRGGAELVAFPETSEHLPDGLVLRDQMLEFGDTYGRGGTMVAGPDGETIVGPVAHEETIVYADIDLDFVRRERHNFDPTGHYSRPDVLRLKVNRSRRSSVVFE